MKKFLLSLTLMTLITLAYGQTTVVESFDSGVLPADWQLAQGMQVQAYNNPDSACQTDFGLQTPGVGGNNPAKILTAPYTFSTSAPFVNVGFTIFIFDASLKCETVKPLPCTTFIQVYLVKATWTSTNTPPPASEILGQSQVQIVLSNQANILYVPLSAPVPTGTQYRIIYDFSVAANCNQNGTKYIIDELTVTTTTGGPLPVKMGAFNASLKSNRVALTWNTETEINNAGFEVERKTANGQYEKVGFVASKAPGGNGSGFNYSFEDAALNAKGVVYYRLRQLDLDGKATYSEIRAVRMANGALTLTVYPNPSRGNTNIALPAGAGSMDISLENFSGGLVQRWMGVMNSNLQLNNLRPGVYVLRVQMRETGEQLTQRILVQ